MSSLRSEWIKLRSVRATWGLVGLSLLAEALFAGLISGLVPVRDLQDGRGAQGVLTGLGLVFVCMLVLGILSVTNEARHHTAIWTFTIEPNRARVVLAKLAVVFAVSLAAGVLFAVINAALAWTILDARGVRLPASGDILESYAGSIVAIGLFGALGVGLGALIRPQVPAIVVGVAVVYVISPLAQLLGGAGSYFPAHAAQALQKAPGDHLLGQIPGGLVLLAYVVALAACGIALVRRRDIGE